MFGLGPLEILVILAAFVIFVGPDKIPEVTKQVARFFVQAKRMSSDVKNVVDDAIRDAEREIEVKEIKHLISDLDTNSEEDDCEQKAHNNSPDDEINPDSCQEENITDEQAGEQTDEEVLSEDGVPNTSIDMNSSIERTDPFGDEGEDEDEDEDKDQDKKSE